MAAAVLSEEAQAVLDLVPTLLAEAEVARDWHWHRLTDHHLRQDTRKRLALAHRHLSGLIEKMRLALKLAELKAGGDDA